MARYLLGRPFQSWADRHPAMQELLFRADAALLAALQAAFRRLPPDRASALGERLGRLIGPRTRKHRHVLDNLALAFPDADMAWRERTARGIWGNFGRVLAEFVFFDQFAHGPLAERLDVQDQGGAALLRKGRRAVLCGAHLGNWEVGLFGTAQLGAVVTAVYSPQSNPYLDRLIQDYRRLLPAELVPVKAAGRELPRAIMRGRSVALLVDQRFDKGALVPFFGRPAPTAVAPARLALRFGLPLVPVRIERLGGLRFRITFYEPLPVEAGRGDEREAAVALTARLNRLFEAWIRERPDQWLCVKRRWPKDRESRQPPATAGLAGSTGV